MPKDENEIIPASPDGENRGRSLTRRGLVAGVLASSACYLLSPCALAWADDAPADDDEAFNKPTECAARTHRVYYDYNGQVTFDGAGWGATLAYNQTARAMTPLFSWPYSNWLGVGVGMLGAGVATKVSCDYANSLFTHIDFMPLVKAYSLARWTWGVPYTGAADQKYYQGWHNIGSQDNRYTLYFDHDGGKTVVAQVTCDLNLQDPPTGAELDISGDANASELQKRRTKDYIQWHSSDATWDSLASGDYKLRLGNDGRKCWFRTIGEYWNFYCNIGNCGGITHGPDDRITLEQDTSLLQWTPVINICKGNGVPHCGVEWAGRIVAICDAGDVNKSLCVGNGTDTAAEGTVLQSWKKGGDWPDATSRLNRNWYVSLNTVGTEDAGSWNSANKWRGTMTIANVMQLNNNAPWCMDQDASNLPVKVYSAKAHIWGGPSGGANQAFWIHTADDKQYIISDATGLVLEHPSYHDDQWGDAGFHCEGTGPDSDFKNWNHPWKLQDVVFKVRNGLYVNIGTRERAVGSWASMDAVKGRTYPFTGSGETGLRYEYMWVKLAEGDDPSYLASSVHVDGKAYIQDVGLVDAYKPANNMLGALGVRALEAVKLKLSDSPKSGGIGYRFRQLGGNNWTEGWDGWSADGGLAGKENESRRNVAFQAYLYGDVGKYFTLRYRAGNSLGWSGWRDEGVICIAPQEDYPGHTIDYPHIEALAIEVVPRAEPLASAPRPSAGSTPSLSSSMPDSASPFSEGGMSRKLTSEDKGSQLIGVARAVVAPWFNSTIYDEPSYLGYVRTSPVEPKDGKSAKVHYIWNKKEIFCDDVLVEGSSSRYDVLPPSQLMTMDSMTSYSYWYQDERQTKRCEEASGGFILVVSEGDYYVYGSDNKKPITLHYMLDGEEIDTDSLAFGVKHWIPDGYQASNPWGLKDELGKFGELDGWYMDEGLTTPLPGDNGLSLTPSTEGVYDYYVWAKSVNRFCTIKYEFADETAKFLGIHTPYADADLATPLNLGDMKPASGVEVRIGERFTPNWSGVTTTAYVERADGGGSMRLTAKVAVYASRSATEASTPLPAPLTVGEAEEITLYVVWAKPTYDGFDAS